MCFFPFSLIAGSSQVRTLPRDDDSKAKPLFRGRVGKRILRAFRGRQQLRTIVRHFGQRHFGAKYKPEPPTSEWLADKLAVRFSMLNI
jgi:hypothetical protein